MNNSEKIRVLVVDDSALMRQLVSQILSSDPAIEVVGVAVDPYCARDKIMLLKPDVLTLDIEMPRMDGLTFLRKLMVSRPMPVVMVSSLTENGCETTLKALEYGAVDFVYKPKVDASTGLMDVGDEIIEKVKVAARANVRRYRVNEENALKNCTTLASTGGVLLNRSQSVIAIGASTGGTEALSEVLRSLPADSPGVVAVIHMPPDFTSQYAKRLDERCSLRVTEARNGDVILPGHVLLAPGNFHMEVCQGGSKFSVKIRTGDRVNQHRPSVDVLFNSTARHLGANAMGVILTGMGDDGASGMLAMHQAGAVTIAQDEATSVVFGMPKAAINYGGVDKVLPLQDIAASIVAATQKMEATTP